MQDCTFVKKTKKNKTKHGYRKHECSGGLDFQTDIQRWIERKRMKRNP